jgi:hypothetical protein
MIVVCKYFELKEEKKMLDGYFIPSKQKLLYICTEDELMMFETVDDSDIRRIFWAALDEVQFLYEQEEDWTEERLEQQKREISGQWI